jgi:predicted nucleic acid-binding protein
MISVIQDGDRLAIDSSGVIAYLNGTEETSSACRWIFDELIATGRNDSVLSTVTVAEALQRPIQRGDHAVRQLLDLLDSFEGLQVRAADFLVAAEAARIRAETGLPLPDAIIIATAVLTSSQVLVTNDRLMAAAARQAVPKLKVVLLSEISAV